MCQRLQCVRFEITMAWCSVRLTDLEDPEKRMWCPMLRLEIQPELLDVFKCASYMERRTNDKNKLYSEGLFKS